MNQDNVHKGWLLLPTPIKGARSSPGTHTAPQEPPGTPLGPTGDFGLTQTRRMSSFLDSIATIVGVFQQHARGDGLSRQRMREIILREFGDGLVKPHDPQTIEKILQFLEWDGDGDIEFHEFLVLVFRVAKCCFTFQSRAPFLVQRTKLPSGGKSLREAEFRSRGNRRQLQEEEEEEGEEEGRQIWERNREVELRRDLRVSGEGEILEERRRDEREGCGRSAEEELILPERSQEPGDRRRRRRGEEGERGNREGFQQEQPPEDVRTGRQRREPQTRQDRWIRRDLGRDERSQRPWGGDRESDNRPLEVEQRELGGRNCRVEELECPQPRRPHQEYLEEPLEIEVGECGRRKREMESVQREIREEQEREERDDPRRKGRMRERRIDQELELELEVSEERTWEGREREIREVGVDGRRERDIYERRRETSVAAAEVDVKVRREIREPRQDPRQRECPRECEEERRICPRREKEEPLRERIIDQEQELELEVSEQRTRIGREREIRDIGPDGRRQRETLRYERDRESSVAAAEVDVKVRREIREPRQDPRQRECPRECEKERRICPRREKEEPLRERRIDQEQELELEVSESHTRVGREREIREIGPDGRRQRETLRYERDRETSVAAAEVDVKVRREIREPRGELRRRECPRECEVEEEPERRICPRRDREQSLREKRVDREQELEVSEQRTWEGREREIREVGVDGRRERDIYERRRETSVAAAEVDVKVRREIQEPRGELRRRECPRECEEEERRICPRREKEEPLRERRIDQEQELELEVSESHTRVGREREIREIGPDGRRQRETLRYERDRESSVAAAEVDVKVRREIREPRGELRRECPRECEEEPEPERRICPRRAREQSLRERRIDQELELEVSEERVQEGRKREIREAEVDARREQEIYGRRRETSVAAAEVDVKVRREIREPRQDPRQRECPRECEEERRICPRRDKEQSLRERRIDQEQELELEVSEQRTRIGREREIREIGAGGRRQRETLRYKRDRETSVAAAEVDVKVRREIREPRGELRRRECPRECEVEEPERRICPRKEREQSLREKRVDREQELELEVSEQRTREGREREIREVGVDGRRERDIYGRRRETSVAAAEVDVKVRREIQEPRGELRRRVCPRECEEEERRICPRREKEEPLRERRIDQEQELELEVSEQRTRVGREREIREIGADGRSQRETLRHERDRESSVAAAEVDVKVRREIREPRQDPRQRECPRECEEERRICPRTAREPSLRERRIDQEQELELEVSEQRTREGRVREIREIGPDGRREKEIYERRRETSVAAAEVDVKVHREIREPRDELRRRECPHECEEERRICPRKEKEEPLRERRIDREQELELEVSEQRTRIGREREIRQAEVDARREQEIYGRRRETSVAAAEVDVKVRREIREPRRDPRQRECPRECEENRKICPRREKEQSLRKRRIDQELELEVSEQRARDRAAEVTPSDQREAREEIRLEVLEEEEEEEEQEQDQKSCLYQTLDVDTAHLCPPGRDVPISDLRVRYCPADPEVQPEVRLLPDPLDPPAVSYLVHVLQNLGDPKSATYEIVCHQPGQPARIQTCSVSPRPPNHPQPPPKSQENPEECLESSGKSEKDELEVVKGQQVKSQETQRCPKDQLQDEGSQKDPGETVREEIQEVPEEESSTNPGGDSQISRDGGQEPSKEPPRDESKTS